MKYIIEWSEQEKKFVATCPSYPNVRFYSGFFLTAAKEIYDFMDDIQKKNLVNKPSKLPEHNESSDPSKLPGYHPNHICGMYCDGQDGNGVCSREKYWGPYSNIIGSKVT